MQQLQVTEEEHQESFKMLKELPPEILDRILFQYCNGKSLSTFAVTLATNRDYEQIAYRTIPGLARRLLLQISSEIERTADDCGSYIGTVRWIRSIAGDDAVDDDNTPCNCDEDDTQHTHTHTRDSKTSDNGKELADRLRRTTTYRRLKSMRRLSEKLAVADFIRQGMKESAHDGQWEWPVWVGRISVSVVVEVTVVRASPLVVITAPIMQHPIHIPGGASHFYRQHRTPTSSFRCEPMNLLPVPPWGRIKGLLSSDGIVLNIIAARLEEAGDNHVAVPAMHQDRDPLDIRILTMRQARKRLESAPRLGRTPSSIWILQDESKSGSNDTQSDDSIDLNPLFFCWHDDTTEDLAPDDRDHIEYMIYLMKTRDRLVQEAGSR